MIVTVRRFDQVVLPERGDKRWRLPSRVIVVVLYRTATRISVAGGENRPRKVAKVFRFVRRIVYEFASATIRRLRLIICRSCASACTVHSSGIIYVTMESVKNNSTIFRFFPFPKKDHCS